ncbi:MAG: STAS domain-containing protein [bacterium]
MTVNSRIIDDNILVIELEGELSIFFKEEVENLVQENVDNSIYKFIFDMSKVTYIDSSGLSILILAGNTSFKNGQKVKIVSPTAQVKYVIDIARIGQILSYYDDIDSAIESFKEDED